MRQWAPKTYNHLKADNHQRRISNRTNTSYGHTLTKGDKVKFVKFAVVSRQKFMKSKYRIQEIVHQ